MTPLAMFPEALDGDCCPWAPTPPPKPAKHSRLHIVAARLAQGLHPLGHARLAHNGQTCGTCSHRRLYQTADRYWKCNQVQMTHGPATDIRLKWPACMRWAQETRPSR